MINDMSRTQRRHGPLWAQEEEAGLMKAKFYILDRENGNRGEYFYDEDIDKDTFEYLFLDGGNCSCDCNRANMLYPDGDVIAECGYTRFAFERIEDEEGNPIFEEDWGN